MTGSHALLSASGSHRWLNCPPSARLEETFASETSVFAAEGTAAHALAEHKLQLFLGQPSQHVPGEFDGEELEYHTDRYVDFAGERITLVRQACPDALVLLEQRLDFSRYVPGGFGTGDLIVVADDTLDVIDLKYGKGDAILQKTYTVDFLTRKTKINEGEIPQYYVENSHPAIIDPEVFDLVQQEFGRRRKRGNTSHTSCFSSRIICAECGGFYGSKVWHSTSKYRRTIWQCNQKFRNKDKCRTPHLYEETLRIAFIEAMNSLIRNKDELIGDYETIISTLADTSGLDKEISLVTDEIAALAEQIRRVIDENTVMVLDQAEYRHRYDSLAGRFETAQARKSQLDEQRQVLRTRRKRLIAYMTLLRQSAGVLTELDEGVWNAAVDAVRIISDHEITFRFKDGSELPWRI